MNTTAKELLTETMRKIEGAYSPSTIRAYKANFERFIEFCESYQRKAIPANPNDVASYIALLTKHGLKSASIRIAVASISSIHKLNQLVDPTLHPDVRIELKRMHRSIGRSSKQAFGITTHIVEKMIKKTTNDLRGKRDEALLLLAYDSLCRRSELTSLRIDNIRWNKDGLPSMIILRKSKTDQEAIGKLLKLNDKTQSSIKKWIDSAKILNGYIFRGVRNNGELSQRLNPGQINRIYKRLAKAANLPEEQVKNISGHSCRVGGAQDLVSSGATLPQIMTKGRWSKPETALRYIENYGQYIS